MTGGDGDDGPADDGPSRRRLLRATAGAAVAGLGLGRLAGAHSDVETRDGESGQDVVAFCGRDAVCASTGATVVIAEREGGDWSVRRLVAEDGFCQVADTGAVVAVEIAGERLPNPSFDLGDAAGGCDGRAAPTTRGDGGPAG